VHSERLELQEPFVELVRRFAHLPGTVALLSGGTLDCAERATYPDHDHRF
jgi:para-aminobenzoate synthetase component 1